MLEFNIAIQTVVVLVILLALLFTYLLGYTFWTRKKGKYWRIYEQKFRDHFFSLILDYAEQAEGHHNADEIIKKVGHRSKDYEFFLNLLEDLDQILDGRERQRLNDLIEHPLFVTFYQQKLRETSKSSNIFACLYFQYTGFIDDSTLGRLIVTSKSSDLKLAYAATKALQSVPRLSTRKKGLIRFFRRDDVSELMVVELLHNFDSDLVKERQEITQAFKDILTKNVSAVSKSMIVRYLGYRQYYEISEFLFQYLKRLQYSQKKSLLIRSLITALGQLREAKAASLIGEYLTQKEVDVPTRLATVNALSKLGQNKDLQLLSQFLLQAEFPIRKAIIEELALQDKERIKLLDQFVIANLNYIKQLQNNGNVSNQIQESIRKIKHIALGINIVLDHRLNRSYDK